MAENLYGNSSNPSSSLIGIDIMDFIGSITDEKEFTQSEFSGSSSRDGSCSGTSSAPSRTSHLDPELRKKSKAYIQIIEQPQPKALRFRYICEGRSAGSIPGVRSTADNKTFPSIKIVNYKGPVVVVVSCVTVDPPYRPHPHNLVGKECGTKGVCTVTINSESMEYSFSNLGIQCVKKKEVEKSLDQREGIRVDPFGTGFAHKKQSQNIDLNSVRLCFQAFLTDEKSGRFTFPLKAIVSDPIYDKKATSDLNICKLSDCTSLVSGGKEIILLCDKVTKEDIQVRFFEVRDGYIEWEGFGDFQASDVHKQVAICFKTPKYKDLQVDHSVKVFIQLFRPSDKSKSEPRPFEYLPMDTDRIYNISKRRKIFEDGNGQLPPNYVDRIYSEALTIPTDFSVEAQARSVSPRIMCIPSRSNPRLADNIKIEPQDSDIRVSPGLALQGMPVKSPISPQHNGGGGGLLYQNISLSPPQSSLQPHLTTSIYYASPSPSGHQVMDIPVHSSPQQQFYQVSQGIPSVDHGCSPYSSENPPSLDGSSAFSLSPMDVLPNTPEESKYRLMSHSHLPYQQTFENLKTPNDANNETLPDLGVINSSELIVESMNNLSASLSCSLNLSDVPMTLNPLDKKNVDEDSKRSLSTPNSDNFFANIPPPSAAEIKSATGNDCFSTSSESVNILKGELETLNKLSEGR